MSDGQVAIDDFPLDFWEHGTIRRILDEEFEMSLLRLLQERGKTVNALDEKRLRDLIVPDVFLQVTETIGWSAAEERACSLAPDHRRIVQDRMRRMLLDYMESGSDAASFMERKWSLQPLALAFRSLPKKVRRFFLF